MKRKVQLAALILLLAPACILAGARLLAVRRVRLEQSIVTGAEHNDAGAVRAALNAGGPADAYKRPALQGPWLSRMLKLLRGRPTGPAGMSALQIAVEQHNTAIVTALLDHGARDLETPYPDWDDQSATYTPLEAAVSRDDVGIVRALMAHGARVRPDILFNTEDADCARLLLDAGASLTARDGYGRTVVSPAAFEDAAVLRLYLERGADPNSADPAGVTPLMLAAYNGKLENVRLLLDHGADPRCTDYYSHTALQIAQIAAPHGPNPSMIAMLKAASDRFNRRHIPVMHSHRPPNGIFFLTGRSLYPMQYHIWRRQEAPPSRPHMAKRRGRRK